MIKKCMLLLLNSMIFLCLAKGQDSISLSLSYKCDDFVLSYNEDSALIINSNKHIVTYDTDINKPAMPYVSFNLLIDKDKEIESMTFTTIDSCVLRDVLMQANPQIVSTNIQVSPSATARVIEYSDSIYPRKNVELHDTHIMDGYKFVTMSVCPYVYDNSNKELRLITSCDIVLSLKPAAQTRGITSAFTGTAMRDVVKDIIQNPDDLDVLYPSATKSSRISNAEQIKYVIITCDSLVSSFQPLADWKTMKGLQAKIITTEYIYQNYNEATPQLKIKRCLSDLKVNHGLEYALLGGDDQIVPVQYCWVEAVLNNNYALPCQDFVPVDMFYSNFDNNFKWNENQNDTIGEIADNIDFTPEIFLSRSPVRSSSDANAFVNKVLLYEQNPPIEEWHDSILMVGVNMFSSEDSLGVEEHKGDKIYDQYINTGQWQGSKVKLYDSYSDIISNSFDRKPLPSSVQKQLEHGYSFLNIMCHGYYGHWLLGVNYDTIYASSLINHRPTLITTSACLTNGFDYSEGPCLSEAFIRNKNSNITAYVGCSREGFSSYTNDLLGMDLFIALFYKDIFSTSTSKSYGKIFKTAKTQPEILKNLNRTDYFERWHQYCLNAIGDPEMPIYPTVPKTLDSIVVDTMYHGFYTISGEYHDPSNISITGKNSDGSDFFLQNSLYDSSAPNFTFSDLPNPATFCITRHGYVPFVFTIKDKKIYLQNTIHDGRHHIKSNSFAIGKDVIDNDFNGPVKVIGGKLNLKYKDNVTINKDFEVKQGATLSISKE